MRHKESWSLPVALLAVLLLASAVAQPAWAGNKSKAMKGLQTVSMEVVPARQAALMTRGKAAAGMAGVVGVMVARQMAQRPNEMSALIEREGIHPEAAVADALRAQLSERSILPVVEGQADAVMRVETGLGVGPAPDGKYRLGLAVKVSFLDAEGRVLWDREDFSGDAVPPADLEQGLLADPDMVREHIRLAAGQVAKILASRIYVSRM